MEWGFKVRVGMGPLGVGCILANILLPMFAVFLHLHFSFSNSNYHIT